MEGSVASGFSSDGLEQATESFDEAVGRRVRAHTAVPSRCFWIILATVFMGSTLGRFTLLHHCWSMVCTRLIGLRLRMALSCSRYSQARTVHWTKACETGALRSALGCGPVWAGYVGGGQHRPLIRGSVHGSMCREGVEGLGHEQGGGLSTEADSPASGLPPRAARFRANCPLGLALRPPVTNNPRRGCASAATGTSLHPWAREVSSKATAQRRGRPPHRRGPHSGCRWLGPGVGAVRPSRATTAKGVSRHKATANASIQRAA